MVLVTIFHNMLVSTPGEKVLQLTLYLHCVVVTYLMVVHRCEKKKHCLHQSECITVSVFTYDQ